MKRKVIFLLSSKLFLALVSSILLLYSNSKHPSKKIMNSNYDEKEVLKNSSESEREEVDINDNESNKEDSEDISDNNYSVSSSNNKNTSSYMESNNKSKSNVINKNSTTESPKNNTTQSNNNQVQEPVVVKELTAWEKLGISEYDYYNTPSDNEGELAFKGSTSLCQNEINRLINKYYDSGIDGGNYYTINGKYTHSYLGCGIKMYMNGKAYTYSQIKSMGFN